MVHLIGLISFSLTLIGAISSVIVELPLWASIIMIISNAGFMVVYRQKKGMIWFVLSLSQSITSLAGTYLFVQWGNSRWALLMVKFPIVILLMVSWMGTLIFWRLYHLSNASPLPTTNRNNSPFQVILKCFRKKKEDPKNAITFVLGEKID